jgi:glucose-6-phosphate 1-dehydrogenase
VASALPKGRSADHSDAFVFFGATGDLAYKQIFPALADLIRDEGFDLPIIGVARSGDLESLKERARRRVRTKTSKHSAPFVGSSGKPGIRFTIWPFRRRCSERS